MPHEATISDQAAAWAVRTGNPAFDDWDGFTAWLEESPEHAAAYDRACLAVAESADLLASAPGAANEDEKEHSAPRGFGHRWFGAALAACLVGLALIGLWQMDGGETYVTAPGEVRAIALDDGSTITLAGGSRLTIEDDDARFASLERGQALFAIRHDAAHPFRVEAGDDVLVDAGTAFDVRMSDAALDVAVSEGLVLFNPDTQNVKLHPGDRLSSPHGSDRYALGRVPLDQVGEWREGRLTFRDASLADVAYDLGRASGIAYRVAPGSEGSTISGSVMVAPLRDDPALIGPLLGVAVRRSGKDWVIETR